MGQHFLIFIVVGQAGKSTRCRLDGGNPEQNCDWGSSDVKSLSLERYSHIHYVYKALLPYGFCECFSEKSLHATPAVTNAKGNPSLQTLLNCSLV